MNQYETDEKIIQLCRSGRKLEAVKLYKDTSGVGLKEAKDYVDSLMGETLKQILGTANLDEQLIQLCNQGAKLEAIKLYREETQCSLKESKDYVDELCEHNTISPENNTSTDLSMMGKTEHKQGFFRKLFSFLSDR